MKRCKLIVPWPEGLHLRPAAALVRAAQGFRSTIHLTCEGRIANLRSILGVMALCATMGTGLDLEISGEDEQDAIQAIEQIFADSGHNTSQPATHVDHGSGSHQ
jgi:phosphocarrier protein